MADSIWDVVYGDNRLNGILGLPDNYSETPKKVFGGGEVVYSPEMDDWETRYDNEGNPYRSRRDVPLHIGHSRDLSLVQPVADVLSKPVEPTVINMTNDQVVQPIQEPMSLYNRQGRADYTPQNIVSDEIVMGEPPLGYYPNELTRAEAEERWYEEQDNINKSEPIERNLSAFQEIAKFDEGGARALYDAYQKGDRISDKVFYEWMDKAGIEGVSERPSTQQMLDEIRSINVMEQAQAKERARLEELQRLEQFKPADFDPAEFDARVQRGLNKTPEWLGQSNNILSDAQREQLNTYDTDYFGNILSTEQSDTDYSGISNWEKQLDRATTLQNEVPFNTDVVDDVDMSFLYEGETVSQGKEPEPTFSDDFVGRNQRRTYEAKKFLSDALGVGGDIADTIMPMLSDTTLGILLNPQHKHHQDVKDTARNLTAGLAQGVMQDLPQGTIDFVVDGINTASNRLGKGDALDSKYWGSIWDVGFSPEEEKALGFDKSTAYGVGKVAGQLGAGYLGLKNVFKTPDTVNKVLKWAKEGLSFALPAGTLDPAMGNISDFVESTDFANAFTEFLSAKPEEQKTAEDRFVARLKTMGEELGLVYTAPALYALVRSPAIKEFAKDMADPKTWGETVEKTTDSLLEMTTLGTTKDGGRKEVFGGSIGAENLGKTESLDKARSLEKSGASKIDIWNKTGFIKGQDGNWRFELDSSKMKLKDDFINKVNDKESYVNGFFKYSKNLEDAIDYPELFKAYPILKKVKANPNANMTPKTAGFQTGKVFGDLDTKIEFSPQGDTRSLFEHEIQHAIQTIENHARGSSASTERALFYLTNPVYQKLKYKAQELANRKKDLNYDIKTTKGQHTEERALKIKERDEVEAEWNDILEEMDAFRERATTDTGFKNYQKVAGEAEAREAQNRLNMSAKERQGLLPTWDNVADEDVLFRYFDDLQESPHKQAITDSSKQQTGVDPIFSGRWDIPHTKAEPITPYVIKEMENTKSSLNVFNQALKKRKNKFDASFEEHINASIPGWQDVEIATGNAITKLYGKNHTMLDIGSSEGSFINTISEISGVKTTGLDPVYSMVQKANSGKNKNTTNIIGALGDAKDSGKFAWYDKSEKLDKFGNPVYVKGKKVFIEDKNKPVHYVDFKDKKYDVINEAMTFQFMSPDRSNHFKRVSELLKDDGIFISKEKVLIPKNTSIFSELPRYRHQLHEEFKNTYKKQHFTDEQISRKVDEVLEGMAENQVTQKEMLNQAKKHFKHIEQIWDSGNFVGYVMGNNKTTVKNFKNAVGDLTSPASSKNVVPFWATNKGVATIAGGSATAGGVGLNWVLSPTEEESQDEPTEEKPMTGVLSNVKTWQPDNNLTNFVKMMENAPLAVGKTGVTEYDDVGHRAKGYGTKAGLLAQDTEEEASKAMIKKLIDANKDVDRLVKIKLNKDERNALVSLIYNIGEGDFAKSKALKALNKGDKKTFVKEAFHPKLGFVKSKGKKGKKQISKGLVNRRTKEKDIFTKGVYGN